MRTLITLTFVMLFSSIYGQTKEETQDWISEKIELYAYSNEYDVFNTYTVTFSSDLMIIRNENRTITNGYKQSLAMVYWIPIKDLTKIRFEEKKNNMWLILKTRGNVESIKFGVDSSNSAMHTNNMSILLEKSITEENLEGRLNTAFNHLIRLYGGNVIEEKF